MSRLDALNTLDEDAAVAEFLRCCGSTRWAHAMVRARPFLNLSEMGATADEVWWSLGRTDWLEAFAAHPRIGEPRSSATSSDEQSGALSASDEARARLAQYNHDYEAGFGYIFIVCASGKSAEEMLAIVATRLMNAPEDELRMAAEEQRKITRLRLAKELA